MSRPDDGPTSHLSFTLSVSWGLGGSVRDRYGRALRAPGVRLMGGLLG